MSYSLPMDQLFDAAKARNSLLPERALREAADFIGKQLTGTEIHRADAVRCVQLAGRFQQYELAGDRSEAIPVTGSRGSSTAHFLKQEYLLAIDPAVRRLRSHYFGQETAPFPDDHDAANQWLNSSGKAEERINKPTRKEQNLKELTRAVSEATGFGLRDVVMYVLCGDEPVPQAVVAHCYGISSPVGDARVNRVEVSLRIRSPDLSQADFQWIRAFVRHAWTPPYGALLRFEDEDAILRRLLIELGDDGDRRRRGFWPDLLARWKEEVEDPDATVPQLKMRDQRLQRKLSQLRGLS